MQDATNLFAGWGDTLTLGGTAWVRKAIGCDDVVERDSPAYGWGERIAVVHWTMLGSAGGWCAGGVRAKGVEFSHWIPRRHLVKIADRLPPQWRRLIVQKFGTSKLNGNFVTPLRHAKHDPHPWVKGMTQRDKWHPILQQIDRVPRVYYGTGIGVGVGIGGQIVNDLVADDIIESAPNLSDTTFSIDQA